LHAGDLAGSLWLPAYLTVLKNYPIQNGFSMKLIHFSLLLCLCSLLCLSGCKGKPANPEGRLDVSGKITLNGGPFKDAGSTLIVFEPIPGPSGSCTASFHPTTGKYLCTMQNALKPGKYLVRISASVQYDRKTGQPVGPDFGLNIKEGEQESKLSYFVALVPPEFNEQSTIEFEVVEGKKNVFDYNIETSYVPDTSPP